MPDTPDRDKKERGPKSQESKIIAFHFPPGVDADVTIRVREPSEPSRAGVRTHTIYESQDDALYDSLVHDMADVADQIMKANFADGKDVIDTPQSLNESLDVFRQRVHALYHTKGKRTAFQFFGRAKSEIFQTVDEIRKLNRPDSKKLEEILRWHIEQGIGTPPAKK
jgi:hypothetical protein